MIKLTQEERAAALRFCETCEDGEGYDVAPAMMKRLAALGLVTKGKKPGWYDQTDTLTMMRDELQHTSDLVAQLNELADVSNELCVALGTALIGVDISKFDHVAKQILQRRDTARRALAKHGY